MSALFEAFADELGQIKLAVKAVTRAEMPTRIAAPMPTSQIIAADLQPGVPSATAPTPKPSPRVAPTLIDPALSKAPVGGGTQAMEAGAGRLARARSALSRVVPKSGLGRAGALAVGGGALGYGLYRGGKALMGGENVPQAAET
jgi:hypothetical protein